MWWDALARCPLPVLREDFPCPANTGENLITQTAFIGEPKASRVLVLIGGTHGVEGFAGTAVECDLLNMIAGGGMEPEPDLALLLINALNPWGYRYLHRYDHLGIDVNRNFIDFDSPLPDNPGYRSLQAIFSVPDRRARADALKEAAERMGTRDYEMAVSGGQYTDPGGPFYGGDRKSHSRQVIETLFDRYQLAEKQLGVIDVHTGLGPYSYGEVICDHPAGSPGLATARRWYGANCMSVDEGVSCSVPKTGLLDYAWHRIMDDRSCYITLEFGTSGTETLFQVLLEDRFDPRAAPAEGDAAIREHFAPADPHWREAVIFRSRHIIFQALAGMRRP